MFSKFSSELLLRYRRITKTIIRIFDVNDDTLGDLIKQLLCVYRTSNTLMILHSKLVFEPYRSFLFLCLFALALEKAISCCHYLFITYLNLVDLVWNEMHINFCDNWQSNGDKWLRIVFTKLFNRMLTIDPPHLHNTVQRTWISGIVQCVIIFYAQFKTTEKLTLKCRRWGK